MILTLALLNVNLVNRQLSLASISVPVGFPQSAGDDFEDTFDPLKGVVCMPTDTARNRSGIL